MPGFGEEKQAPFGGHGAAPAASVRPPTRLSKDEFCRWIERQEAKFEWKDGRVVQMSNVSKAHARVTANLLRTISARLDLDRWSVTASDLGVEAEGFIRYPDIIVEPMDTDDKGRRARAPVLLVEVLSPSSVGIDFTEKRAEYASFASLQAYLVVSQDEALVWAWQRGDDGLLPAMPVEIAGREASIHLAGLSLDVPLAEIFRGVAPGRTA